MLGISRFDEMTSEEYNQAFREIVESVKEWKKDFSPKKFAYATNNLKEQLMDAGMSKGEAQRLIWSGSVNKEK